MREADPDAVEPHIEPCIVTRSNGNIGSVPLRVASAVPCAAVSPEGQLYTWGPASAALGHGLRNSAWDDDAGAEVALDPAVREPKVVEAMQGHRVMRVECGSDAVHTCVIVQW